MDIRRSELDFLGQRRGQCTMMSYLPYRQTITPLNALEMWKPKSLLSRAVILPLHVREAPHRQNRTIVTTKGRDESTGSVNASWMRQMYRAAISKLPFPTTSCCLGRCSPCLAGSSGCIKGPCDPFLYGFCRSLNLAIIVCFPLRRCGGGDVAL